jgi:AraC-like DNA-binding protein
MGHGPLRGRTGVLYEPEMDGLTPVGEVIGEVIRRTPMEGPNRTEWRGLTCHRYERPPTPQWNEVHSLTLCFVVQGRKRVQVGGTNYFYDPFNYLVMTRGMRYHAEILEATPAKPFLSIMIQADPVVVKHLSSQMHARTMALFQRPIERIPAAFVSPLDTELIEPTLRFLRSLGNETDRQILGPLYFQEMVYRVLQNEQCQRLTRAAVGESDSNPVAAAICYMQEDLSRSLTLADLADAVTMSQSAFAQVFKSTTGLNPYHFVKRLRLERARAMLVEECASVRETAASVGYASLTHFISEFRRTFGMSPGVYVESHWKSVPLAVGEMTGA